MKKILAIFLLLTFASSCKCQELRKYIVYIFHEDWRRNSSKWNTGDYLWIIPYDTCYTEINIAQLRPFFVTEEQKNELVDSQEQGIGNLPVVLNEKTDLNGYMLFKKKKLIQKHKYENLYSGIKRTLSVHVVPIKAVCQNDYLGIHKKSVMRIDGALEIWNGFWKNEVANTYPYLFYDFSLFNFIVSYGNQWDGSQDLRNERPEVER